MAEKNAVVAIYNSHDKTEAAIKNLQKGGFDMKNLSIVGKDYHNEEHVTGYYTTGDGMKYWGKMEVFWDGLWGYMVGAAFFAIPGIGPVVMAGPLVSAIIEGLKGAVIVGGVSALGVGMYSIGIPKENVTQYESAIKAAKFLVVANGTPQELAKAKSIIDTTGAARITTHSAENE